VALHSIPFFVRNHLCGRMRILEFWRQKSHSTAQSIDQK